MVLEISVTLQNQIKLSILAFNALPVILRLQQSPKSNQMKSKVTLLVLVAEIIGIVVLHSARSTDMPANNKSENIHAASTAPFAEEKQPISYTSLK